MVHDCGRTGNARVAVFSKNGTFVHSISDGKESEEEGKFKMPTGVAVDNGPECGSTAGRLYTVEYGNHRMQIFEKTPPFR